MKMALRWLFLAAIGPCWALTVSAQVTVQTGELAGPTDWLAEVRLRNFQTAVSGDYEMMVNADPNRTVGANQVNGHVPTFAYNQAAWATTNDFWITYNPSASLLSLRLLGSGPQAGGATGGYDVTISRAPDAVTAGPVNYINFQLWDRVNFPTFSSLTMSSLDGQNLGSFSIPSLGIGNWSFMDPGGAVLNNGFVLQGSFTLDLAKVNEGKEGDKLVWAIGHNSNVIPEPSTYAAIFGVAVLGFAGARRLRLRG